MITIGIVGNEKHQKIVKRLLEQFLLHPMENIEIVGITKTIDFTSIFLSPIHILLDTSREWKTSPGQDYGMDSILDTQGIMIMNWDNMNYFSWHKYQSMSIITYGINPKACVTASSIQQDMSGNTTIQCCVQRPFITRDGELIEPQEFTVHMQTPIQEDLDLILGVITATLVIPKKSRYLVSNHEATSLQIASVSLIPHIF
ncbi:MAG: hypothetical protein GX962_06495 [Epulopiscium sp.]|nr:hypothetical protein [Candidatus Epulonipiscium sp.]